MKLLLDTHTFIWWQAKSSLLPEKICTRIKDKENRIYISTVTVWEMILKAGVGKLTIPESIEGAVERNGFYPLPITFKHAEAIKDLPFHHKDPFDRLLISQAQVEGLTLVSRNNVFKKYGVKVLW